ncbi:hypothetical protein PHSY_004498 [Pseudozyma hubeiensis SY62]|uniref:Uncharacterized protein n=1 Tax=Pseudozyma hubeiensis (strain SY62) TaxID=1305764 RepID=R9P6G0_PSEHS|nr:hypothetical protein PHSY_004498 [Pseudozyma hubeiensis SY62]GAC96914.1 hypothetical protein PHSY_004498 [Pseudozyma hubeiensis SY62]
MLNSSLSRGALPLPMPYASMAIRHRRLALERTPAMQRDGGSAVASCCTAFFNSQPPLRRLRRVLLPNFFSTFSAISASEAGSGSVCDRKISEHTETSKDSFVFRRSLAHQTVSQPPPS